MSKAPFVAMRTDLRKEERVLVIADIAGYNRHEALGRLFDLWAWCTDRYLTDAPDDCEGYAVSEAAICRFLGPLGVRAILADNIDEFALGELRSDGLIYLRGTADTVSRLRALRKTASAGGRARVGGKPPKRRGGRFVGNKTNAPAGHQPETSSRPAADQQLTSSEPAATSEIPQATSHKPQRDPEIPPSAAKRSRAAKLEPDWVPERSEANQAAEAVAKSAGVDLRAELLKLHDWALANGAKKADWDATWRNWIRSSRPAARAGPTGSVARAEKPALGRVEPSPSHKYADGDQKI